MVTLNNIDGIFPLTTESVSNLEESKGTRIKVNLIESKSNKKEKEVSWVLSNWTEIWKITVDILDRCLNCLLISEDKKYCEWSQFNKGPLWKNLPTYYICPDFQPED